MIVLSPEMTPSRGRVALLVPRWTNMDEIEPQGVPFRSFTIGGAFLAAGYEVVFFDQEHDLDRTDRFEELCGCLEDCTAAFIWFNEMYPLNQSNNSHMLASRLKSCRQDLPVVVGGELISVLPTEMFDIQTPIDFFLRGYGEDSALELVGSLESGEGCAGVDGLVWWDDVGILHSNDLGEPPIFRPEFLELFDRVDLTSYIQIGGVFGNDARTLTISAGRGCVKSCSFCVWSGHPSTLLDAEVYYNLMVRLQERYEVSQFHIGELDFFTDTKRALELARLLSKRGADIQWFALGCPIDLLDYSEEDWDLLRDGGLVKIELGTESGSTRLLRSFGKRHTADEVYAVTVRMLDRGIVPMNNFLFGFPGETAADREDSMLLIDRLMRKAFNRTHFTYRHYQPAWETDVGKRALSCAPDRPRRLDQWLAERPIYADEGSRTMPWLSTHDETDVKRMIEFDLPLATSRLVLDEFWPNLMYRALRLRAQRRLRKGCRRQPVDRWLYENFIACRLDQTFIA